MVLCEQVILAELEQHFNMGKWARSTSLSEVAINTKTSALREVDGELGQDGPPSISKVGL